MADHLVTGLIEVQITCGNLSCGLTWTQGLDPLPRIGWHVCPQCNHGAPVNISRDLGTDATPEDRAARAALLKLVHDDHEEDDELGLPVSVCDVARAMVPPIPRAPMTCGGCGGPVVATTNQTVTLSSDPAECRCGDCWTPPVDQAARSAAIGALLHSPVFAFKPTGVELEEMTDTVLRAYLRQA